MPDRRNLLRRTAGPYIGVKTRNANHVCSATNNRQWELERTRPFRERVFTQPRSFPEVGRAKRELCFAVRNGRRQLDRLIQGERRLPAGFSFAIVATNMSEHPELFGELPSPKAVLFWQHPILINNGWSS